VVGVRWWD